MIEKNGRQCTFPCMIEGPYGKPGLDIHSDRYKSFLLISGGIGVTPMQSICNKLLYDMECGRPLEKLYFVWACRDKAMVNLCRLYDEEYYKMNCQRNHQIVFNLICYQKVQ
eukprot:UN01240